MRWCGRWAPKPLSDAVTQSGNILTSSTSPLGICCSAIGTVTPAKRGADVEAIRLRKFELCPMASLPLSLCTPAVFAKYRDERLAQVSCSTVRRELTILRHVFEMARKEWAVPLPSNPVAGIKRPADGKPRERRLRPGEFERLIEGCDLGRSVLLAPIIILAVETGLRRGELLSIRWHDVCADSRTVIIRETKNGHPRMIPYPEERLRHFGKFQRPTSGPSRLRQMQCG